MQIRSVECTGCLECVAICPAKDALVIAAPGRRAMAPWVMAAGIAIIFLGLVSYAKLAGHWDTHLPKQLYFQLVPAAAAQEHP